MIINENNSGWLYKKNKLGKILVWKTEVVPYSGIDSHSITTTTYGQYNGKMQTEVTVVTPKANRTLLQQVELEVTSLYNKQRDKGYKSAKDLGIIMAYHEEGDAYYMTNLEGDKRKWSTKIEAIEALLPKDTTDANGNLKPMKCTPYEGNAKKKVKFPCYVQPKLDGVRCFIMHDGTKWIALSSSGKSYDVAARHILQQIESFSDNTDIIFDGELYIHGKPLQEISGLCRKQIPVVEQYKLEYHIFDIAEKVPFRERVEFIWTGLLTLDNGTFPNLDFVNTIVAHEELDITTFHNQAVSQGYEGAIIRNADLGYEFGKRSTNIFKLKDFKDEEFDIIGIRAGKRGSEDMVFLLRTEKGEEFAANPIGTREQKEEWFNNKETWASKQATVRYLTLSNNGVPQGNPVLKAIRDYED